MDKEGQMVVDEIELRRKRALFRATHRGTMEMDWLLGRYAEARLDEMDGQALDHFEDFLSLPDPDLQHMIMDRDVAVDPDHRALVERLREFHGLGRRPDATVPTK